VVWEKLGDGLRYGGSLLFAERFGIPETLWPRTLGGFPHDQANDNGSRQGPSAYLITPNHTREALLVQSGFERERRVYRRGQGSLETISEKTGG
jgi:hypothetical protein